MNEADSWKIIKWILIVLVAGFIGQFGKMLASHIIDRAKRKRNKGAGIERANRTGEAAPADEDPLRERQGDLKAEAKARKKELKTAIKMTKKKVGERKE